MTNQPLYINYNNYTFSPTPALSHTYHTVRLNGQVWGNVDSITLNGFFTGVSNTGFYENIANIFSGNFGSMIVYEGSTNSANPIYNWNQVAVQEITVDESVYGLGTFLKYSIKLKQYNIPSGIIDASNEYSFEQAEDGTAQVTHKIFAQGVRTFVDPLTNAITFVSLFTGQSILPNFIPNGSWILLSVNEQINRVQSTYTVTETYKFMTGLYQNFLQISTLTIDKSNDKDYITLQYNTKYQISPITGSISNLDSYINSNGYLTEINNIYGISSPLIYQNGYTIEQNFRAGIIDVKLSYISGLNGDILGYFDSTVNLECDLVAQKNLWTVDSDFKTIGPLSFRLNNVNNFIANNPIQSYLTSTINNSPLALGSPNGYGHSSYGVSETNQILNIKSELNSGTAQLKWGISTRDFNDAYLSNMINPKFSIDYMPPKWQMEMMASANIEGSYVIQDLNCLSNCNFSLECQSSSSGDPGNFINLPFLFQNISGNYVGNSGFNIKSTNTSGILDRTLMSQWLISDILSGTSFSQNKVYGSISSNYVRQMGYNFGF